MIHTDDNYIYYNVPKKNISGETEIHLILTIGFHLYTPKVHIWRRENDIKR